MGDVGQKAVAIAPGMSAMFSGSVPKAKELIDRYMKYLNDPLTMRTPEHAIDFLRQPLEAQQRSDVQAYLSAKLGMPYATFLDKDAHSQLVLVADFWTWNQRCDLIIIWSDAGFVRLFSVTDRVEERSLLATIGIGANVAETVLRSREYSGLQDLGEAIYYVYEAKRTSESVGGVGKETHMTILEFDPGQGKNRAWFLNPRELEQLEKEYAELGPKPFEALKPDARLSLKFIPEMS